MLIILLAHHLLSSTNFCNMYPHVCDNPTEFVIIFPGLWVTEEWERRESHRKPLPGLPVALQWGNTHSTHSQLKDLKLRFNIIRCKIKKASDGLSASSPPNSALTDKVPKLNLSPLYQRAIPLPFISGQQKQVYRFIVYRFIQTSQSQSHLPIGRRRHPTFLILQSLPPSQSPQLFT